jgi:hypothetical protein
MKLELKILARSLEDYGLSHHATTIHSLAEITNDDFYNVTHVVLDALGLVPGFGEVADLSNAILYVSKGMDPENLLNAAFSIISCIPEVGDIIAKVPKYGIQVGKEVLEAAVEQIFKHETEIKAIFMKLKNADVAAYLKELPGGSNLVGAADQLWPIIENWIIGVMSSEVKAEMMPYLT